MPINTLPSSSLGSNVITVTANTGSIINANSINFNNTATATVAVSQGAGGSSNGVANVAITARVSMGLLMALGG